MFSWQPHGQFAISWQGVVRPLPWIYLHAWHWPLFHPGQPLLLSFARRDDPTLCPDRPPW